VGLDQEFTDYEWLILLIQERKEAPGAPGATIQLSPKGIKLFSCQQAENFLIGDFILLSKTGTGGWAGRKLSGR
jgi:hypothetical protein